MKNWILAAASLMAASSAALAQGKMTLVNDSLHLVYFNPDPTFLKPGDGPLGGQAVTTNQTPSGVSFVVGLYASLSSSTLSLQGTTTFNAARGPGLFGPTQVDLTGISGGVTAFFQVWVWESAYANSALSPYAGASPIFTATTGTLTPNSILNSTWSSGPYPLGQYGTGSKGSIEVTLVPEPEIPALVGLGMAVLWIWRRGK
jgi:hypothetical protein